MLKEAIEKIVELAGPKTITDQYGQVWSDRPMKVVERERQRPDKLAVSSLDSIASLVRKEAVENFEEGVPIYVHVTGYKTVRVFTGYLDDYSRDVLYEATADVPDFRGGYRDRETALIELRSLFLPGEGVEYLLDLLSRISDESQVTSVDNGVTQTVEASHGISLKSTVAVRPRVELQPFRTFLEVDQPASEFLLRIDGSDRVGLFEADGGVWKLEAKNNIAAYLREALADEIKSDKVVVMV